MPINNRDLNIALLGKFGGACQAAEARPND
jgi:hypothetical protein